jgi:hypothetical protein
MEIDLLQIRHHDRTAPRGADRRPDRRTCRIFSFGTNDLTQTTFGISRDDAETGFLIEYMESGILPANPFATLDRDGVGNSSTWP